MLDCVPIFRFLTDRGCCGILGMNSAIGRLGFLLLLFPAFVWCEEESAGKNATKNPVEFYRNLFRIKRKDQIEALESLLVMDDVEKQAKMVTIMLQTIVKTIGRGKETLEREGYKAGDSFPEKEEVKDGLSMVLENTALFTDLVVRFPFIAQGELKKNNERWTEMLNWARNVCRESGVYVDKHALILKSLGQELGLDEPDPGYENPFKVKPQTDPQTAEERQREYEEKKRKEKLNARKRKRPPGPKLSRTEL